MNDVLRVSGPGLRVARGPHMTYDTRWPPQAWGPNPVSTLRGNPFGAHPGYGYADGAGTGMRPSAYSATLTVGTDGTNPSYPGYGTTVPGTLVAVSLLSRLKMTLAPKLCTRCRHHRVGAISRQASAPARTMAPKTITRSLASSTPPLTARSPYHTERL